MPEAARQPVPQEVLIFTLGQEQYGVDILKVQEIRDYTNVTRVAGVPDFIRGVTNLRGEVVPVVDLRLKFAIGAADFTSETVVIVINVNERIVGVIVDSVSDVVSLTPEQVTPAPRFGNQINSNYLLGLANVDERMLILLNVDTMLSSHEMQLTDADDDECMELAPRAT